jgi:hypothetical protein
MSIGLKVGIGIILLILLGLVAFGIQHEYVAYGEEQYTHGATTQKGIDQVAYDALSQSAAAELATATAAATAINEANANLIAQQNVKDANNANHVTNLNKQLVAARGMFHDPNAKPGECGYSSGGTVPGAGASAGPGPANPAGSTGIFSDQFSSVLLGNAKLADDINNAYISCQAALMKKAQAPATP